MTGFLSGFTLILTLFLTSVNATCETAYVGAGRYLCNVTLATVTVNCTDVNDFWPGPPTIHHIIGLAQHPTTKTLYLLATTTFTSQDSAERSLFSFKVDGFGGDGQYIIQNFTHIVAYSDSNTAFSGITFGGCINGEIVLYGITGMQSGRFSLLISVRS